jgi:hypothetical protein
MYHIPHFKAKDYQEVIRFMHAHLVATQSQFHWKFSMKK